MDTSIPQDIAELIWESIDRVETLETLLLLRATRERTWTLDQLTHEMRSSRLAVVKTVSRLVGGGLVAVEDSGVQFRPQTPELDEKATRLATFYRERSRAVIQTIFSRPKNTSS